MYIYIYIYIYTYEYISLNCSRNSIYVTLAFYLILSHPSAIVKYALYHATHCMSQCHNFHMGRAPTSAFFLVAINTVERAVLAVVLILPLPPIAGDHTFVAANRLIASLAHGMIIIHKTNLVSAKNAIVVRSVVDHLLMAEEDAGPLSQLAEDRSFDQSRSKERFSLISCQSVLAPCLARRDTPASAT